MKGVNTPESATPDSTLTLPCTCLSLLDEDYGDITDFESGTDIKVNCYKPPGRQYAITDVSPRRKSSAIFDDKKKVKEWMDNIPSLDDLYTLKSYEELEGIINAWLDPSASDDSGDSNVGTVRESTGDSDSGSSGSSAKFKDLDDAFNQLQDL